MANDDVRSQEWIDKIEALVRRAESLTDPVARSVVVDLTQAVLDFHAAGLDRMLEITASENEELIGRFAGDDLIASLLLLHDLHPDDLETRILHAVDKLAEMFRSLGAKVTLLSIAEGIVRLNFDSPRPWTGAPVRTSIENAIVQAAPEITSVVIEGLKEPLPANFVPIADLVTTNGSHV